MREAFTIVFEDEYVVVLNKTAKILVHPSPKKEKNTLTSLLGERLKEAVFPCHRLDRETTGLMIYAKARDIQREIMLQFRRGEVKKRYVAFIRGRLRSGRGRLEDVILDREGRRFREKPKLAKTLYGCLSVRRDFSVIELEPLTGRTNQLRIQLAKMGHPILGERKYAFRRDFKVDFRRLALHAFFLSFVHPVSRERLNLKIGLPEDMKVFLSK